MLGEKEKADRVQTQRKSQVTCFIASSSPAFFINLSDARNITTSSEVFITGKMDNYRLLDQTEEGEFHPKTPANSVYNSSADL